MKGWAPVKAGLKNVAEEISKKFYRPVKQFGEPSKL